MIRLLSTDFDGTLVNHLSTPAVTPELFETFDALRKNGVRWAVNTGRALGHILHGLEEFAFPFSPDFVLASERHIFQPDGNGGWKDYGDWNARCESAHDELFKSAQPVLAEIREFIAKKTNARSIDDESGIGLIASDDAELDRIVAFIDEARRHVPTFHYQRNTVYLRFCHADYSKGAALGELARLLGLSRDEVFAAGDHLNDIPMLDGQHARWVACPANSADAVKATVRKAGGYVARGDCSAGVVEALEYFANKQNATAKNDAHVLAL